MMKKLKEDRPCDWLYSTLRGHGFQGTRHTDHSHALHRYCGKADENAAAWIEKVSDQQ